MPRYLARSSEINAHLYDRSAPPDYMITRLVENLLVSIFNRARGGRRAPAQIAAVEPAPLPADAVVLGRTLGGESPGEAVALSPDVVLCCYLCRDQRATVRQAAQKKLRGRNLPVGTPKTQPTKTVPNGQCRRERNRSRAFVWTL